MPVIYELHNMRQVSVT